MASKQVLGSSGNDYANETLLSFTQGIEWDKKLYLQELKVQVAWLDLLKDERIITHEEHASLFDGLEKIKDQMAKESFNWQISSEDIHMNIELALTDQLGELGKKIHFGRSRNDLIATTLRLHVADFVDKAIEEVEAGAKCLQLKAETYQDLVVPGMTHLQNAQPTTMGHILMSYAWSWLRVKSFLGFAKEQALATLPLGAAAFNGTTLDADYDKLAKALGFQAPCHNSYDVVGDRDYMLLAIDAMKLHASHLAELSQDLIYWASTPVSLLKLPKNWSTGSSIMPNKRNPDVAELLRAKTFKIMAKPSHQVVSSFGSSYCSDLHELKKLYLETSDEFLELHKVITPFLSELEFDAHAAKDLLSTGHLLATDYANQLVEQGMSFRDAYKMTAEKVAAAEGKGIQIHELDEVKVDFEGAVSLRKLPGGSGAFEQQTSSFLKELEK